MKTILFFSTLTIFPVVPKVGIFYMTSELYRIKPTLK